MKKILLIAAMLFPTMEICAQNSSIGYWTGTMERDGSIINVAFEFKIQSGKLVGFYNAASQRASGIPLDSLQTKGDSLTFQLMIEPVTFFNCSVSANIITGKVVQEGFSKATVLLTRTIKQANAFTFADTSFKSGDHRIACRVYLPLRKVKCPAVIFMHGSGGEGMFANQYLAEYLASKGIVTLIQDKQGVGKSTGNWTKASFEQLTDDYVNATAFMTTITKVNQKQIGIYGHSQGGTLAPLVASKSKYVSFVIAAAAVGDSVYKQDLYRVENNLKSNEFNEVEIREAMFYYKSWLDMARTGSGFDQLDSLNKASKDKKWFEWVEAPPRDHWIWNYYRATGNYNSLDYWQHVAIPTLLVYGENDQIEDIKKYRQNIDRTLSKQQINKDVTEIILPDAQHNLCIFPEKNGNFFWWYLSKGYENLLASWILLRFKN
jgi:alpha-beta hydrolase superfamily lysophospholipase